MAKQKWYAVRKGRECNVVKETWAETKELIEGVSGAEYRSFSSQDEAVRWLKGDIIASGKFYGVRSGEGCVFGSWDECKDYISKHKGVEYKSFKSEEDAKAFSQGKEIPSQPKFVLRNPDLPTFYIDGSRDEEGRIGYGIYLVNKGTSFSYSGRVEGDTGNITGELAAFAMTYISCVDAIDRGKDEFQHINLVYDYEGIKKWLDGTWEPHKPEAKLYRKFYDRLQENKDTMLTIEFYKVKGHTNVEGNKQADSLARKGTHSDKCKSLLEILEYERVAEET